MTCSATPNRVGHLARGLEFVLVALAVAEAEAVHVEALVLGDREHGGRVQAAAHEHDCRLVHRASSIVVAVSSGRLASRSDQLSHRVGREQRAATDPDGWQLAGAHQPVDARLRDPQHCSHLGDREERLERGSRGLADTIRSFHVLSRYCGDRTDPTPS